ncbi:MAG: hypothetical protein KKA42_13140 [candidate division Zixibacteria bacterium]|nr:hypothetical protein [candidate division Zixibacteria bacterium]
MNALKDAMQSRPITLLFAYYVSLLVFLMASFYPEGRIWGLNWWAYYPLPLRLGFFAIGALIPLMVKPLMRQWRTDKRDRRRISWSLLSVCVVLSFATLFYFLRAETFFLGDGYQVLARLAEGGTPVRAWQPGLYLVLDSLHGLFDMEGQPTALRTFRTVSWSSGTLMLVSILFVAARLYESNRDRLLFSLGVASGGYMLLSFGYVENYPLFALSVTVFAFVGLLSALDQWNRWVVVLPLMFACTLHPFGVFLAPAAVYILCRNTTLSSWLDALRPLTKGSLIAALTLLLTLFFTHLYVDNYVIRFALLPLWPNEFAVDGYWLLSFSHMADYVNLLFLLLPGLALVLASITTSQLRYLGTQPDTRFLLVLLAGCGAAAFAFDPKLGMPRDWDLFSFVGVPLAVLGTRFLLYEDSRTKQNGLRATLAVVLALLILLPRAGSIASQPRSVQHAWNYANLDELKSRSARFALLQHFERKGDRSAIDKLRTEWTRIFSMERLFDSAGVRAAEGDNKGVIDALARIVQADPLNHVGWYNLGLRYLKGNQNDSALYCLRVSDGLNPNNYDVNMHLATCYARMDEFDLAEEALFDAYAIDTTNVDPLLALSNLYKRSGSETMYVSTFLRIADREDAPVQFLFGAAELRIKVGDFQAAANGYSRAMSKGLDSALVRQQVANHPELGEYLRFPDE